MISAAVIFHRLGPYHFARLRAAGATVALTAIETSGADETYAWDLVAGADGFQRITLFESADAQKQPTPEVVMRMTAALSKLQPQVVVIPGWADVAALAALKWASAHNVPVVTMSESTEWDEVRKSWKEWVKRQVVGLCSASLVGGSPHKDYIVQLGMPEDRVFLGYDAVDNDYFANKVAEVRGQTSEVRQIEGGKNQKAEGAEESRKQKVESRNKFGLPENYFLASNRFIEKKNLPRLLEAYALYRKKAESRKQKAEIWDLMLLGDGEMKPALTALRSALGLHDHVHMPGFIQYPELPHYYARAGAFIHASTTEQWGLVVNEAMASGLPVLVSNRCGCARDLVQDGVNGFTFDPYNVEQMADAMLRVASMEQGARSQMGSASCSIVAEWGPERFAAGVKAAAECALRVSPKKPTFIQKAILNLLLRR